tara:strand:- start:3464 stop:3862 length:399 start_codon:yes stop_codon:yes gene_type:complete
MTERRKKILNKLLKANPSEEEQKMLNLVIERITIDMAEFYEKFYNAEGAGAIVYAPKSEDNTMFYLTVEHLANAIEDMSSRDMKELADIMRKAIVKAETINPKIEALFILQDPNYLSLIHYDKNEKKTIQDG